MTRFRDPGKFLTAEWRHLAMLNYACPPELLAPLVPDGVVLDDFEGRCYVSLVGFLFLNTRLMGVPVPFHRHFEEVNLRFYVRRHTPEGVRRGVVFVRELVPRRAIAAVARTVYNENYTALPMSHRIAPDSGIVEYGWKFGTVENRIRCETEGAAREAPEGSEAEFITEHYWGYARSRSGSTTEYRVEHPKWRVRRAVAHLAEGDFAGLYGEAFGKVLAGPALSAFVAEGSPVIVRRGVTLERDASVPTVPSGA